MSNVLQDFAHGLTNWGAALVGAQHPVFNSLGRQIGYFSDPAQLASGHVMIFAGEANPGADGWYVNDFWGNQVTAAAWLIGRGFQPSWVSPAAAAQVKAGQDAKDPTLTANYDFLFPPVDFGPFQFNATPAASADAPPLLAAPQPAVNATPLILAGAGVLGLALLFSGGRGARR